LKHFATEIRIVLFENTLISEAFGRSALFAPMLERNQQEAKKKQNELPERRKELAVKLTKDITQKKTSRRRSR
jgi:hypothetical protein